MSNYYSVFGDVYIQDKVPVLPNRHYSKLIKSIPKSKLNEILKFIRLLSGVDNYRLVQGYIEEIPEIILTEEFQVLPSFVERTYPFYDELIKETIELVLNKKDFNPNLIPSYFIYSLYQLGLTEEQLLFILGRDSSLDKEDLDYSYKYLIFKNVGRVMENLLIYGINCNDIELSNFIHYLDYYRYNLVRSSAKTPIKDLVKKIDFNI